MADPKQAVDFVLRQEDSTLSGIITHTPGDLGGTTRFGLTRANHPKLDALGFFDASMPAATALPLAEETYAEEYANPLLIAQIVDQGVATALLSFAINEEGAGDKGRAVKILQDSCRALGASIAADGEEGPATVAAVNACGPKMLLALYCENQIAHYNAIVAANPSQVKFIKGWVNRANELAALRA